MQWWRCRWRWWCWWRWVLVEVVVLVVLVVVEVVVLVVVLVPKIYTIFGYLVIPVLGIGHQTKKRKHKQDVTTVKLYTTGSDPMTRISDQACHQHM